MRHPALPLDRLLSALLQIAVICALLSGCASLPDVRDLSASLYPRAGPEIQDGQGKLPQQRAISVLSQRLKNSAIDLKALAALEEAATRSPLIKGNKVTLLFDGPKTIAAMMAAISNAKSHVNLETYIFAQDELGMKFADLLIAKQRAGVQVNIIYDSVGTLGTPVEFFEKMREAGISLTEFNPANPLKRFGLWRVNNRDHRKILVVDGRIGFAGGINIADDYAKSSPFRSRKKSDSEMGWRDTHVQIEGPAVASLQWLFLDAWTSQNTQDLPDRDFFPALTEVGDKIVRVIASEPGSDFEIYKTYVLAIQEARKSIHLTASYFVPDAQILESLIQAARRGVSVKLVVPSVTDVNLVMYAGRSSYDELLEAGVRLYQFQSSVLHAKTAVIDGVWSTVGSANIDVRSFLHNHEINIVVLGEEFGNNMEAAFREDIRNSNEITMETWRARPFFERIKEWAARSMEYWL
jgi:cardiolipin synthase